MSKRKVAKHRKKYWRKHSDVKDVEEAVAEKRREEVFGEAAVEKSDKDLFVIERTSKRTIESSKGKSNALRSEYHCSNHSAVTLPKQGTKKRTDHDDNSISSDDEPDVPQELMYNYVNHVTANNVKTRAFNSLTRNLIKSDPIDIWANKGQEEFSSLPKRPGAVSRPNIANIEIPHSGTSYNPSFKDHQRLLHKANADEEKKLRKAQKLNTTMKMPRMTEDEREEQWRIELSQGLNDTGSEDDAIDDDDDNGINIHARPPARKTNKQRRKERLLKKAEKLQKAVKQDRIRMSDIYRIKSLRKEIIAKESQTKDKMLKRLQRKQERLNGTRRVGKYKYEKPPVDVQLSSELCGSLRLLQAHGNFMTERYKSLQRRNMVEPKGPPLKSRYRKRPRVKWTESRSYELRTL